MKTALVCGAVANKYLSGGEAWVRLSWVRGLSRLGLDVYFAEQIDPSTCRDEGGRAAPFEHCANRLYFESVMAEFGLSHRSVLVLGDGDQTAGMGFDDLVEVATGSDVLVNISGHLTLEPVLRAARRKAYVDLDPGFTQIWHASPDIDFRIEDHDFHFTVGENIGAPDCEIPTGGIEWRPLPPPVVLEDWPVVTGGDPQRFTTVGSWRGAFGPVEWHGRTYGVKAHEFRKYIELPGSAPFRFEVALDIHPADAKDRDALEANGWRLVHPATCAAGPTRFREYVQGSGSEFSVAQGIYVDTNSGWFSDRTVRYLASGKPVLVQDTGFTRNHPAGEGLLAFSDMREAVDGARSIVADYEAHSQAARRIAEERFGSDRVLSRFLEEIGYGP